MTASILIVEDEADLRELIRYNLEADDFRVVTAESGDEAVERIRDGVPDLILLDWMLPGLSGIELCRRWRSREETARTPIIMITARGEEEERVARPRHRRRRLCGETVLDAGTGRPHPGAAPPLEPAAVPTAQGRRSRARPPEPPRPPFRPRSASGPDRIPPARISDAPSGPGLFARAIASTASGATTSMSMSAPSTCMSAACARRSIAAAKPTRSAPCAGQDMRSTSGFAAVN